MVYYSERNVTRIDILYHNIIQLNDTVAANREWEEKFDSHILLLY